MQKKVTLRTETELENEINMLKPKYGTVYSIEINLDDDGEEITDYKGEVQRVPQTCNCLFRDMDNDEYTSFQMMWRKDEIFAYEYFVKVCHIGGDTKDIVVGNDYALRSLYQPINTIVYVQPSTYKKENGVFVVSVNIGEEEIIEEVADESGAHVSRWVEKTSDCQFRVPNRVEYPELNRLLLFSGSIPTAEYFINTLYLGGQSTQEELLANPIALKSLDVAISYLMYQIPSRLKKN